MPRSLQLKAYKMLERFSGNDLYYPTVELPFGLYVKRVRQITVSEALATHLCLHPHDDSRPYRF